MTDFTDDKPIEQINDVVDEYPIDRDLCKIPQNPLNSHQDI